MCISPLDHRTLHISPDCNKKCSEEVFFICITVWNYYSVLNILQEQNDTRDTQVTSNSLYFTSRNRDEKKVK